MKAFVDPELCIGCTQCAGLCPEVYQMEGTLAVAIPGDLSLIHISEPTRPY